jgi:CsoR family transcriptional regulator, copper-sensing transcriptional repressor
LKNQENIIRRLNRIEGQIRGINRMITAGEDCEKVMLQISAVKAALDKAGLLYIQDNLDKCLQNGVEISPETKSYVSHLLSVISKLL